MKSLLTIAASTLLLFGVATAPALAGDHDHGRSRDYRSHDGNWRHDRGNDRRGHDWRRDRDDYRVEYRGYGHYRPGPPRVVYYPSRYERRPARVIYRPAPMPYWSRGGRYYGSGYAQTYRINDWGYYGLRTPPPGYYWRRSDAGDFLLVALTTGIIADIILHH